MLAANGRERTGNTPVIPRWPIVVAAIIIVVIAAFTLLSPGERTDRDGMIIVPAANRDSFAYVLTLEGVSVTDTQHAVQKHGSDAIQIRRCLNRPGGTIDVWKLNTWRRPNQFFQVCQMDDGRMGLRLIDKLKNGSWREKTSFVVKSGTPAETLEYLTARAARWVGKLSEWHFVLPPS